MDQLSAHLDRGWDLVGRGDLAGAALSARKCLELDEGSAEAHHLLGYVRAAEGHAEEALEHYRRAIDLDESFVEAMLDAAGLIVDRGGDPREALRLVDDALEWIEDEPERADALLLKVEAYLRAGDVDAARRTLALLPDEPFDVAELEFLRGRAYAEIGDTERAERHLRRAIELVPDHAEAHHELGHLLERTGREAEARLEFLRTQRADAIAPAPAWAPSREDFEGTVAVAIGHLPPELRAALDGTLVVVTDVPGAEVVADGVDPRVPVLIDAAAEPAEPPRAGRLFVYQRNVERMAGGPDRLEATTVEAIENELGAVFPSLEPIVQSRRAARESFERGGQEGSGSTSAGPGDD